MYRGATLRTRPSHPSSQGRPRVGPEPLESMADVTPRSRAPGPVQAGPVVLLPPARPGGPERRFAVRPARVLLLLAATFLAGGALAAAFLLPVLEQRRADVVAERDSLRDRYEALQADLERLEAEAAAARAPSEEPTPTDDSTPSSPSLRLAPPTDVDGVRIAVLRTTEDVTLKGEGLIIVQSATKAIPMPGGVLLARTNKQGVFVDGVGTVASGTRVENRLGPIVIGKKSYPGALELHRDGDRLLVINELELEKYLLGVVGAEVPAGWPLEAKKAQSVVARTYALMQRAEAEGPYHLEATIADQVYAGTAVDSTTRAAVTSTHGEVLLQDGLLVSTWFHSACGGTTEAPADVWPDRPAHGNAVVSCGFCDTSPYDAWTVDVTPASLVEGLRADGHTVAAVTELHIRARTDSERVRTIDILTDAGTVSMTGQDFREMVGYMKLKSAAFSVEVAGEVFRLSGGGFGHGVGMCQHGALGMDKAGRAYREILTHYYPQARVEKIY